MMFLYEKSQTLRKNQDNLPKFFFIENPYTLRYAIFNGNFEIGVGGLHFYEQKSVHFALNFYLQKTMLFPLRFFIQKAGHFGHIFLWKNNALCVTFYI